MENQANITDHVILNKIYEIRGQKVMLDRDLAELYQVETKHLKQAVRRNMERFPDDFMFEMTKDEFHNWRSQFVTSNSDLMGLRYLPMCFTEQGVAMLSSVLKSEVAIKVNIQIIRLFTRIRELLLDQSNLKLSIQELKNKVEDHDEKLEQIFRYIQSLHQKGNSERDRIGFKK
ncbi:MAG: ORF6N domain-containing protein [Crocinitomicaceae bacterium]